jgi:hypothetical protein
VVKVIKRLSDEFLFQYGSSSAKFEMPKPIIMVVQFDITVANVPEKFAKFIGHVIEMQEEYFMVSDNGFIKFSNFKGKSQAYMLFGEAVE